MNAVKNKCLLLFSLLTAPFVTLAQVAGEKPTFPLKQTMVLLVVAGSLIVMVAIIYFLAKNMTHLLRIIMDKSKDSSKRASVILFVVSATLIPSLLHAQNTTAIATSNLFDFNHIVLYLLIAVYVTLLIIIIWLLRNFQKLINEAYGKPVTEVNIGGVKKTWFDSVLDVFNSSVPLEREKDVLLDHDYDGVRELDNSLPPWWKYGFYVTIIFAFIYLYRFHVSGSGKLSGAEYQEEMDIAAAQKQLLLKGSVENINENNVTQLTDAASLADAKSVFVNVCSACHGKNGEGLVGPNLTDKYWLHGGDVKSIFKTITYGYPAKGMVAWGQTYKPSDIQKLASYVLSLQGTNPPNPKAPQGDLFTPGSAPTDTTAKVTDTTHAKS